MGYRSLASRHLCTLHIKGSLTSRSTTQTLNMSSPSPIDPNHNALRPHFEKRLGPKYVSLYNKHIRGKKLAHEFDIEEVRKNPVILGFG